MQTLVDFTYSRWAVRFREGGLGFRVGGSQWGSFTLQFRFILGRVLIPHFLGKAKETPASRAAELPMWCKEIYLTQALQVQEHKLNRVSVLARACQVKTVLRVAICSHNHHTLSAKFPPIQSHRCWPPWKGLNTESEPSTANKNEHTKLGLRLRT